MNVIFLLIILRILGSCLAEEPKSYCIGSKPFRAKDKGCQNFTHTCVKTDDKDCQSFMGVCAQCPATNYSFLMFHDISLIKVELQNTKDNFNKTTAEMKEKLSVITIQLKNNEDKTNILYYLLWATFGIILLLIFIIIFEIRFKIITKLIDHKKRKANRHNYEILESRKSFKEKSFNDSVKKTIEESIKIIENKIDHMNKLQLSTEDKIVEKFEQIMKNLQLSPDTNLQKIKFRINGFMKPLELKIKEDANIVQIKKEICSELHHCKPDDFKIMKLKINGKLLKDNGYFPVTDLLSTNDEVYCDFNRSIDPSNIVVLTIEADFYLPKLIQAEKTESISKLLNSIASDQDCDYLDYFIESKIETDKQILKKLEKEKSIEQLELQDYDIIYAINQINERMSMESIFDEEKRIIEYSNTDYISQLKKDVANKFNCPTNDIALFSKNGVLDENLRAFQYNLIKDLSIKYCRLIDFQKENIEIIKPPLIMGCFSELYRAKKRNQEILIKKYENRVNEKFEDCTHIINELQTFRITKSNERFVQLLGVYKSENYVYVAMENMENGSLNMFLKANKDQTINLNDVAKWTYQILEGLQFLHNNNIIHRDLNPSSLLLDSSFDIKLSSFNLSKYSDFHTPSSINVKSPQLKGLPVKYLAPEIITKDIYNARTDVWSVGAVLIKISTKKNPYPGVKNANIIEIIKEKKNNNYTCPDSIPTELRRFIDLCMKGSPNERASIDSLLKDKFLQDYFERK